MYKAGLAVLFFALAFFNVAYAEPRNLDLAKQEIIRYYNSGEYEKDVARTIDQAKAYLQARLEANKKDQKKLAIVLDIDETSLSNYADMIKMGFGGTLKDIEDAEGKGTDQAIKPTLELYQFAKANNVAVFFVTARHEVYRPGTELNLTNAGYKNYDGLYLLPMDYNEKTVATFKSSVRKMIEDKGYDIALNISDQEADLRGGHADKSFKLPDPFYLVP
ncbi:MAG TPA: HAD family acid phosphatase [Gammaproteobacteria bacterium]|nr:HAD family acid phosphatase [Gammaproteobacteria bacterium]